MSTGAVLGLSLGTDVGLAWALLFRERETALSTPRLLAAAGAGLLFALLKGFVIVLLAGRGFLAIHVVHSFVFLAAPAIGVLVALGRPRPARPTARVTAAVFTLLLAAIGIDSSLIEPYALRTETARVEVDPSRAGRAELLVGVLSDIQCTEVTDFERDAVARVMAAKPDLILLPGDLTQCLNGEWPGIIVPMRELLAQLHAPLGVYCVQGNCDSPAGVLALTKGTDVQLLLNEVVHRTWRDREVTIAGVELGIGTDAAKAVLREMNQTGGDDLRIVCAHLPDVVLKLPEAGANAGRVDLVVAGHTHGGQVRLPWIGPLITLTRVPRDVAGGGLHELHGVPIYVSRGIGHEQGEAPRVRFNCPPEVSLLTLATHGEAAPGP